MARKQLKVGVRQGGGPPPGYEWSVWILQRAYSEALAAFTEAEYAHLKMQVQDLARHADPTHSTTLSLGHFPGARRGFLELREKGGPLGKKNVRIFFGIDHKRRIIVILGCIKKEADGQTPTGDVVAIGRRWRRYINGEYEVPDSQQG